MQHYQLLISVVPPVGGVVVKGQQPQQWVAVSNLSGGQQPEGLVHPVGTLDQHEPGLKYDVNTTAREMTSYYVRSWCLNII